MLRDVHMALFATETKIETTQMAINKELAVKGSCVYTMENYVVVKKTEVVQNIWTRTDVRNM